VVICLEQGADLLMPLPLTVSCFSEIQIGFTFLVPAHPSSPGKKAVKQVCVCVDPCTRVCIRPGRDIPNQLASDLYPACSGRGVDVTVEDN